jgi:hypothetical protein
MKRWAQSAFSQRQFVIDLSSSVGELVAHVPLEVATPRIDRFTAMKPSFRAIKSDLRGRIKDRLN